MNLTPRISIHILLPEAVDRRFRRRAQKLPGASWPAWGGHVTLVPWFVPSCPPQQVFDLVAEAVSGFAAFCIRMSKAVVENDVTRPDYRAVFIEVEEPESGDEPVLPRLQAAIAAALEPVRQDHNPELAAIPYRPHLTLALGVGEAEAMALVNDWRADPLEAEFLADAVWLVLMWPDEREPGSDRVAIRLAKPLLPLDRLPPGTLSD